jgi:gliding motility-associated-like protein
VNEISINAFPGPIPDAGPDGAFCGSPVQLSGAVTNPVSGVTYNYSWSPGSSLSNPNTANPTVTNMSQTTDFIMSVQPSDDPQCLVTDTLTLFIPLTPPNIPIDSLEWCAGGNTTLPLPAGGEGWDYTWLFSETLEGTPEVIQTEDVGHQASNGGYYYVTYSEPVCGFTGEASYFVELQACQVIIPNVFTPNGDGNNDQLVIQGLEDFPRSTIRVYNRWGALLYESDNYRNNWSPRDLAEGTYYFILGVRKNTGEYEYYESHLTLLRK